MQQEINVIRRASPDEAEFLTELSLRSKAHWGYSNAQMVAFRDELTVSSDYLSDQSTECFVMLRDAKTIGFYALAVIDETTIELDGLFVEPIAIGSGAGRALLEHAKKGAQSMGGQILRIQSDPNAEGFYVAAGGVVTGQRESGSIKGRYLPLITIIL